MKLHIWTYLQDHTHTHTHTRTHTHTHTHTCTHTHTQTHIFTDVHYIYKFKFKGNMKSIVIGLNIYVLKNFEAVIKSTYDYNPKKN